MSHMEPKLMVEISFPVTSEFIRKNIFDRSTMKSFAPLLIDDEYRDTTWMIVPKNEYDMDEMVKNLEKHPDVEFAEKDKIYNHRPFSPSTDELMALFENAGVRQKPIKDYKLTVNELKQMNIPELIEELKSLGLTDLECLRIENQLNRNAPLFIEKRNVTSEQIERDHEKWKSTLMKQDMHYMEIFNPGLLKKSKLTRKWHRKK